jgi:hypothetical protein
MERIASAFLMPAPKTVVFGCRWVPLATPVFTVPVNKRQAKAETNEDSVKGYGECYGLD